MIVRTAFDVLPSPARVHPPTRAPLRVGLIQLQWNPDPAQHECRDDGDHGRYQPRT